MKVVGRRRWRLVMANPKFNEIEGFRDSEDLLRDGVMKKLDDDADAAIALRCSCSEL